MDQLLDTIENQLCSHKVKTTFASYYYVMFLASIHSYLITFTRTMRYENEADGFFARSMYEWNFLIEYNITAGSHHFSKGPISHSVPLLVSLTSPDELAEFANIYVDLQNLLRSIKSPSNVRDQDKRMASSLDNCAELVMVATGILESKHDPLLGDWGVELARLHQRLVSTRNYDLFQLHVRKLKSKINRLQLHNN